MNYNTYLTTYKHLYLLTTERLLQLIIIFHVWQLLYRMVLS